jgi:stage III sporulation protein AA
MEDISYVINTASHYSPWAASTMSKGYLTAPGGHRIGVCGEVSVSKGNSVGFRSVRSLSIRVARDFPGIAAQLQNVKGNVLVLGPPGSGKTTLLRDLLRQIAEKDSVTVIDERGELFPQGITSGRHMDILSGCPKAEGLMMAVRTMGPACVAVDEITSTEDCSALTEAGWCGVRLLATAHGTDIPDLRKRRIYQPLLDTGLFETVVVMRMDKRYRLERL